MSKWRKAQNAASLISPSRVVKLCVHVIDANPSGRKVQCYAYARACYDAQGDYVGNYCPTHAREHGHCPTCGETLTQAEKDDPDDLGRCARHRPHDPGDEWWDEDDTDQEADTDWWKDDDDFQEDDVR